MITRNGTRHVYTVPEGATFKFLGPGFDNGAIGIVVHPDWPPLFVMRDGSTQEAFPPPSTKTE